MKGEKIYQKAITISKIMYGEQSKMSEAERIEMYNRYLLLLRKAAYKGNPKAQFDLGLQYEDMNYLSLNNPNYNPSKAMYWYNKACDNNEADACNNLGHGYEKGEGCKQDLNKALELYEKSADLGYSIGKQNYKKMVRDLAKVGRYNK